jgi:hypothetical protein
VPTRPVGDHLARIRASGLGSAGNSLPPQQRGVTGRDGDGEIRRPGRRYTAR